MIFIKRHSITRSGIPIINIVGLYNIEFFFLLIYCTEQTEIPPRRPIQALSVLTLLNLKDYSVDSWNIIWTSQGMQSFGILYNFYSAGWSRPEEGPGKCIHGLATSMLQQYMIHIFHNDDVSNGQTPCRPLFSPPSMLVLAFRENYNHIYN